MVTDEQLNLARECFGPSIDFSRVKIKESPFVSGTRPWTCGNVIRVKKPEPGSTSVVDSSDLIHEFGHVWQHQNGQLVFLSALAEQVRASIFRGFNPYNYGGPDGVKPPSTLFGFFTESQAQIIAEYWKSQHGIPHDRLQNLFSQDYVQNLFRLIQEARIGSAAPAKATVAGLIDSAVARIVNWVLGLFE